MVSGILKLTWPREWISRCKILSFSFCLQVDGNKGMNIFWKAQHLNITDMYSSIRFKSPLRYKQYSVHYKICGVGIVTQQAKTPFVGVLSALLPFQLPFGMPVPHMWGWRSGLLVLACRSPGYCGYLCDEPMDIRSFFHSLSVNLPLNYVINYL